MYRIREDFNLKVNQTQLSEFSGIAQPTLSNILLGKVACRKVVALCITKFINNEAEIEKYFTREEK